MKSQKKLVIKMKPKKIGFQRINPWSPGNTSDSKQGVGCNSKKIDISVRKRNPLTEQWREMIRQRGPYYFFITITFGVLTGFEARCQYTNYLLYQFNRRLFRHNYKKRKKFVEGFAFFEDHPSQCTDNKPHIHLLVEHNEVYDKKRVDRCIEMFFSAAAEVVNGWNNFVFNTKGLDFQVAGYDKIDYCMKNMWDRTITDMKILCMDGLSDNQRRERYCGAR